MSDYQKEQSEAFSLVLRHLQRISPSELPALQKTIEAYLTFRTDVDVFLSQHFNDICTSSCYESRLSACCSREGIITFFADVVVNVLKSKEDEIERLIKILGLPNQGFKCVYLDETGCRWRIKPIVCRMYLCEKATNTIFDRTPSARRDWERIKQREKTFTWPDRPVLFDQLERIFMDAGYSSPLMYMHNSPGLLRVKKRGNQVNNK